MLIMLRKVIIRERSKIEVYENKLFEMLLDAGFTRKSSIRKFSEDLKANYKDLNVKMELFAECWLAEIQLSELEEGERRWRKSRERRHFYCMNFKEMREQIYNDSYEAYLFHTYSEIHRKIGSVSNLEKWLHETTIL